MFICSLWTGQDQCFLYFVLFGVQICLVCGYNSCVHSLSVLGLFKSLKSQLQDCSLHHRLHEIKYFGIFLCKCSCKKMKVLKCTFGIKIELESHIGKVCNDDMWHFLMPWKLHFTLSEET